MNNATTDSSSFLFSVFRKCQHQWQRGQCYHPSVDGNQQSSLGLGNRKIIGNICKQPYRNEFRSVEDK